MTGVYYYLLEDESRRPCRVMRYRLGDNPASATEVYNETDVRFFAGLSEAEVAKMKKSGIVQ